MSQRWFSNHGQKIQVAASVITLSLYIGLFRWISTQPPWIVAGLGLLVGVGIGVGLQRLLPGRPDAGIMPKAEPTTWLKVRDILLERADGVPGVVYTRKLRLVVTNVSDHALVLGPGTKWVSMVGDLKVRPLPQHVWEAEGGGGWHADSWKGVEHAELTIHPGQTARTWVGLDQSVDETKIPRHAVSDTLGMLLVPIKAGSGTFEQRIRL